jgi:hypothetical protein
MIHLTYKGLVQVYQLVFENAIIQETPYGRLFLCVYCNNELIPLPHTSHRLSLYVNAALKHGCYGKFIPEEEIIKIEK